MFLLGEVPLGLLVLAFFRVFYGGLYYGFLLVVLGFQRLGKNVESFSPILTNVHEHRIFSLKDVSALKHQSDTMVIHASSSRLCLFGSMGGNSVDNKRGTPGGIRGNAYGEGNNSTIPTPLEAARAVGVVPTMEASQKTWQRAWRLHKALLPLLHKFDSCCPPNSSLNLACLWWKAIAGNDPKSPAYDNGLSHDLLPRGTRFIVSKRLRRFYPRLHHANVEIRTAFLDKSITNTISTVKKSDEKIKIRLICLGAGYDLRSIKFLERNLVDEAIEIDLNDVILAKKKLIGPKRLLRRRPWLKQTQMPTFIPGDLNEIQDLKNILNGVLAHKKEDTSTKWHNIFVFEAVMIYLNEGVPSSLLNLTSTVLKENGVSGSLCFADRLENIPGGDEVLGRIEMGKNGWILNQWCPKPGLARHMGSADLK